VAWVRGSNQVGKKSHCHGFACAPHPICYFPRPFGVYLNLVEGRLWVPEAERSNRFTPTENLVETLGFLLLWDCEVGDGHHAESDWGLLRETGRLLWDSYVTRWWGHGAMGARDPSTAALTRGEMSAPRPSEPRAPDYRREPWGAPPPPSGSPS
jgi:hypothetical protein